MLGIGVVGLRTGLQSKYTVFFLLVRDRVDFWTGDEYSKSALDCSVHYLYRDSVTIPCLGILLSRFCSAVHFLMPVSDLIFRKVSFKSGDSVYGVLCSSIKPRFLVDV